jgi:hypothetical protein
LDAIATPSVGTKRSKLDRDREQLEKIKKLFPNPLDPIHEQFLLPGHKRATYVSGRQRVADRKMQKLKFRRGLGVVNFEE